MKAFVVVDLGFGDAGKGLLTDYLVRKHEAGLVVRFNGGAQAGHNVVEAGGRQHTFSQVGSGTFVPGVKTHLARPVVVHPTALFVEARRLEALGERNVLDRFSVDPLCKVTTPFQQAAGRLRELLRGLERHGSCGVGVGETVSDWVATPELTLHFRDLYEPRRARERLFAQREQKLTELASLIPRLPNEGIRSELRLLQDPNVPERWLQAAANVARAVRTLEDEELPQIAGAIVFEGAQGVLLDERFGFHPFTTYSRCTPEVPLELLSRLGFSGELERIGVLRTHAIRHGPGPLPTEDERVAALTPELHNVQGQWQGAVRKGWPDLMLLDYAVRACQGLDSLAVTHLDSLAAFADYRWCESYAGCAQLPLPSNLSEQEALTKLLLAAEPRYDALSPFAGGATATSFCGALAEHTRMHVRYASTGPTARDVFERA